MAAGSTLTNRESRSDVAASSVIELVRRFPEPTDVPWGDVDLDAFLHRCDGHRVACLLGPTVGASAEVPAAAVEHFRLVELRRKFGRARLQRDLEIVRTALVSADVPWVVLKGPALVAAVYDGGPRESSDLDLLVEGLDLGATLDALLAAGAAMIDQNFDLLRSMGSGEVAIVLPNGTVGDLHWHPIHEYRVRRHFDIDVAMLLARRQVPDAAPHVPSLDATDTVLYLCMHACLSGGDRLLWAKDIDLAVRRLSWSPEELVSRARATGTTLATAAMFSRTRTIMRTPVDSGLLRQLAGRSMWLFLLQVSERILGRHGRRTSVLLRLMYRSTRATELSSLTELLRALVYNSLLRNWADASRPWRTKGPGGVHPASIASAPPARQRFLDEIQREINA